MCLDIDVFLLFYYHFNSYGCYPSVPFRYVKLKFMAYRLHRIFK